MNRRLFLPCLLALTVAAGGCDRLKPKKTGVQRKKPHATAAASASAMPSGSAALAAAAPHAAAAHSAASKKDAQDAKSGFALPFAWESSEEDPLARTRGFLREALRDNREYMKHGPKFFETFAKAQKPRATVIACADSRVQSGAWDLTPENDDFTVRNIGNQVVTSLGSVEYGIEHLNTPVLLIVGHTGCGAVKAAMGDKSHLSEPIAHDIGALSIPKELEGQTTDSAWTKAVIANIHAQVSVALEHFAQSVHEGKLTVVGALYDFRNDFGKGAGKMTIIDVNGNSDTARLESFVDAVTTAKGAPALEEASPTVVPNGKNDAEPPADTGATVDAVKKRLEGLMLLEKQPTSGKEAH